MMTKFFFLSHSIKSVIKVGGIYEKKKQKTRTITLFQNYIDNKNKNINVVKIKIGILINRKIYRIKRKRRHKLADVFIEVKTCRQKK